MAAEALGVPVRDAVVYAGGGGLTRHAVTVDALLIVPIALAGMAAEQLAFGTYDPEVSCVDQACADHWAYKLHGRPDLDVLDELVGRERRRVAALLAGRWTDVESVAEVLLHCGIYRPELAAGLAA